MGYGISYKEYNHARFKHQKTLLLRDSASTQGQMVDWNDHVSYSLNSLNGGGISYIGDYIGEHYTVRVLEGDTRSLDY